MVEHDVAAFEAEMAYVGARLGNNSARILRILEAWSVGDGSGHTGEKHHEAFVAQRQETSFSGTFMWYFPNNRTIELM